MTALHHKFMDEMQHSEQFLEYMIFSRVRSLIANFLLDFMSCLKSRFLRQKFEMPSLIFVPQLDYLNFHSKNSAMALKFRD